MANNSRCINRSGDPRTALIGCIHEVLIGGMIVGNMLVSIRIKGD